MAWEDTFFEFLNISRHPSVFWGSAIAYFSPCHSFLLYQATRRLQSIAIPVGIILQIQQPIITTMLPSTEKLHATAGFKTSRTTKDSRRLDDRLRPCPDPGRAFPHTATAPAPAICENPRSGQLFVRPFEVQPPARFPLPFRPLLPYSRRGRQTGPRPMLPRRAGTALDAVPKHP